MTYKRNVLVITEEYRFYNNIKKKLMKDCIVYRNIDYRNNKFKLPSIDQIYVIGLKEDEHKWRRILYRKGLQIQVSYMKKI